MMRVRKLHDSVISNLFGSTMSLLYGVFCLYMSTMIAEE